MGNEWIGIAVITAAIVIPVTAAITVLFIKFKEFWNDLGDEKRFLTEDESKKVRERIDYLLWNAKEYQSMIRWEYAYYMIPKYARWLDEGVLKSIDVDLDLQEDAKALTKNATGQDKWTKARMNQDREKESFLDMLEINGQIVVFNDEAKYKKALKMVEKQQKKLNIASD